MARSVIIPSRILDGDHFLSKVNYIPSSTDAVGVSTEYTAGREPRPAELNAANTGKLKPTTCGDEITADSYSDTWMRIDGNVDAARWGKKDRAASNYQGKLAANIVTHVEVIRTYTGTDAEGPKHPKWCVLKGGSILLVWHEGTNTSWNWQVWNPASGWGARATQNSYLQTIVGVAPVQMSDGQIIVFVAGTWAFPSSYAVVEKYTCQTDPPIAINQFVRAPVKFPTVGTATYGLKAMAVEALPSGRLAMLMQFYDAAGSPTTYGHLKRFYSDDRGASWSQPAEAGDYGVLPTTASGAALNAQIAGLPPTDNINSDYCGLTIRRLRTGALMALAPCLAGNFSGSLTVGVPNDDTCCMRALVSDDGDSWADMIRSNYYVALTDGGNRSVAFPLMPEGMINGGIAQRDDGYVSILGCYHGDGDARDSGGTALNTIFDDFVLLTLGKPTVTGSDVGATIVNGTYPTGSNGQVVSCSDAFTSSSVGPYNIPTRKQLTAHRMNCLVGVGLNNLDGSGEGAPAFKGPKFVDVVNYRGSLWVAAACTCLTPAPDIHTIVIFRLQPWSSLQERVTDVTAVATVLDGGTYNFCWLPIDTPSSLSAADWSLVGAVVSSSITEAQMGLYHSTAAAGYYQAATLPGTKNKKAWLRFQMRPLTGGSAGTNNIALQINQTDGAGNTYTVTFQFANTTFRATDPRGGVLGTANPVDITTYGVEVVCYFSAAGTLGGIWYRQLAYDLEDNYWVQLVAAGTALVAGAGATDSILFGHFTAVASTSAWHHIAYCRSTSATDNGFAYLNTGTYAWDAATPIITEFVNDAIGYDDGFNHGTRAQFCTATEQYVRDGLRVRWVGSGGKRGDRSVVRSGYEQGVDKMLIAPVAARWRSNDFSANTYISFDAGNDEFWSPDAMALFGCNMHTFYVEFDTLSTFNSVGGANPAVSLLVAPTGGSYTRHYFARSGGMTIEGANNQILRLTGDTGLTDGPLFPSQFRSNDLVQWLAYSAANAATYKIIDNDKYRIFFEESVAGASAGVVYVYPDRIAFPLSGGNLATTGYRYWRLRIPTQDLPGDKQADGTISTGYMRIGLIVLGNTWRLDDPHPDWEWSLGITPPVSTIEAMSGPWVKLQSELPRRSWTMSMSGLLERPVRTALTVVPGVTTASARRRMNHRSVAEMLDAAKWGERVVALLPEYSDAMATGGVMSTRDVYPVRILGPYGARHAAYEGCRTSDVAGTVRSVLDLDSLTFEEIG